MVLQLAEIRPPILTGNDQSMEQYESFRAHAAHDPPDELELAPEDFTDINHLNGRGARKYTMWLAQALIAEGTL
jgi:hypothetical protein